MNALIVLFLGLRLLLDFLSFFFQSHTVEAMGKNFSQLRISVFTLLCTTLYCCGSMKKLQLPQTCATEKVEEVPKGVKTTVLGFISWWSFRSAFPWHNDYAQLHFIEACKGTGGLITTHLVYM